MSSLLPSYTHIVNPKLKHTYLSFDDTGSLVIKSPGLSPHHIEQLLIKKSAWIQRSKKKIASKKGYYPDFSKDPHLYFLGQAVPVLLERHTLKNTKLIFENSLFRLQYHTYDPERFTKHIDTFYRQKAQQYIPPRVEQWAKRMGVTFQSVRFRKTKRQWGSCSCSNTLSFNTMLMKLPQKLIDYVIVHELSHINHKHHRQTFWQCVEHYLPDYKANVAELKTYTP
ncbi:Putative predicted metal-dependent hydrolase [hydrothermal vent metagenome]|uniref:Putative predicted metal-dependent hydrolase n=1 Tax=hydrothermal vent metagenome TaxID=652676 RepID=A0A1W1E871_9ZZZZ